MDRGNRRILLASTLLALPTALLMVSLSAGTTPTTMLAVGQAGDDAGAIQLVVGKQPESNARSGTGILKAIAEGFSQPPSQSTHQHQHQHHHQHATQNEQPQGLLDGLFKGRLEAKQPTPAKQISKTSPKHTQPSVASSATASNEPADWNGIPYHAGNSSLSSSEKTPIRDLEAESKTATRIIRGGSSRAVQATPASVRRPTGPPVEADPAPTLAPPVRTSEIASAQQNTPSFSTSSSSRRSGRRIVGPLDESEIAAASKKPSPAAEGNNEADESLVPNVKRREVAEAVPTQQEWATPNELADSPAPVTTPPSAQSVVAPQSTPVPQPTPAAQPTLAASEPPTALAEIASSAPASRDADTAPARQPISTLSAPRPTSPSYTTPDIPATQGVPTAGLPSHPFAASTPIPSTSASHRVGPLQSDFEPRQTVPQFNPVSTPVGSGVVGRVPNGDVAVYEPPAVDPPHDPYALVPGRMSTNGTPVGSPAAALPAQTSSASTTEVPMHPINGYPRTADSRNHAMATVTDDFSGANHRNHMRGATSHDASLPGQTAVASELPGIRVVTHGPGEIMIRQTHEYEIRVENRGSIDAEGVMVRALIPEWAEIRGQNASRGDIDTELHGSTDRLVWTIDHLPAGSAERMFVRLMANHSGTYQLDVDWTLVPQKSVARIQVHEPKLELTIDGPDEVIYGQSQTYKVRVLNPGDGTAPNVVFTLSPNSATPQTQRIGDIPPGKEAQFEVELTAQDLGDLKINGLAAGDLDLRAESAKTIHVAAAQLEAMLSGPELKYQNTEALYNLQIQNTGAASSERIVATLKLPLGVKYEGGLDDATRTGTTLRWEIDALTPGAIRNYQFRCTMVATGEHLFSFDCKGTAAGKADVSLATSVESIADLVLTISDPTAPAPIGAEVTYEIVVRNRGSKEATDVRAIAQFSHGIEPQRIEGQTGEVLTGQVVFDPIDRIAAGQEVRLRVIAKADRAGHHRFRSEVRSGDTVLVAEEATHYMSPKSDRVSRRSTDNENR